MSHAAGGSTSRSVRGGSYSRASTSSWGDRGARTLRSTPHRDPISSSCEGAGPSGGAGRLPRGRSWEPDEQTIPTLQEEETTSGGFSVPPALPDISQIPPQSRQVPLREPPRLPLEPPVDEEEEEEYEYPLCDCACFEIYWSTFCSNICSKTLGMNLKHSSKRGTPAHGRKRPLKEGKVAKALKKLGAKANKKGSELKQEWEQRRPSSWTYQDAHCQEMELELQRLRRQVTEQSSLPCTLPPGSNNQPWSSAQFRMPPGHHDGQRRFTMQ